MSSRNSRVPPTRHTRNTRSRRNIVLDVDLNALPPECHDHEGNLAHASPYNVSGVEQGSSTQPAPIPPIAPVAPIDVEAFDDDIVISSPRAFAAAKNNSRRTRPNTVVVDVDSEERPREAGTRRTKRRRTAAGQASVINLEDVDHSPPPPSPPKEATFKCPVCLGLLVDATSTKCGHVFCKDCLRASLAAQSKCPTCRKRSLLKDTIRVYLPATL